MGVLCRFKACSNSSGDHGSFGGFRRFGRGSFAVRGSAGSSFGAVGTLFRPYVEIGPHLINIISKASFRTVCTRPAGHHLPADLKRDRQLQICGLIGMA